MRTKEQPCAICGKAFFVGQIMRTLIIDGLPAFIHPKCDPLHDDISRRDQEAADKDEQSKQEHQ